MYGARIHGLMDEVVRVQSRVSRLSYGWILSALFVEGVHHIEDKYWHSLQHRYKAKGQMEWAIRRVSLRDR